MLESDWEGVAGLGERLVRDLAQAWWILALALLLALALSLAWLGLLRCCALPAVWIGTNTQHSTYHTLVQI